MTRPTMILATAVLAAGCATLDPSAVNDLAVKEQVVLEAVSERLSQNRAAMMEAAEALGELGAEWSEEAFKLERELAKARRLESMRSPWAAVNDDFARTQRSVVLYHLYEVEMAEQKVLDARKAERRASARELARSYDRLAGLVGSATGNLELVIENLDQSKSAQFRSVAAAFLQEVSAFRTELQKSDHPRLRALAEDVARHEAAVVSFKQQADQAFQAFLQLQGQP